MSDGNLSFSTGAWLGDWVIVKASGRYAVCRFSNERMRITSDGVFFGETLRTVENSLETHWFNTWEFANAAKRSFESLDQVLINFNRPKITLDSTYNLGVGVSSYSFYQSPQSNWSCYLFGNTPNGTGIVYKPNDGQVPNAFVRWCMKIMLGCTWIRNKT